MIIAIAIVLDLSEHLAKFLDNKVPLKEIIFQYYLSFIPYYTNLFLFLFVFISVIFFTSKMAAKNEIVAILSSGISFFRLLMPYFYAAFIVALLSWFLGNFIIPPANKHRVAFEEKYFRHTSPFSSRNIHKQVSPGVFLYIQYFDIRNNVAHTFSIEKFENSQLKSKLFAKYARWDSVKNKWTAFDYFIRHYYGTYDKIEYGHSIDTNVNLTPEDLKTQNIDITTLNLPQLNKYIEKERLRGSENINAYLLEKYKRTAYPFSTFILTFIGVAISSKKQKGGTGINIGIGIALSFTYIFFMQVSDQFALKGGMNPLLAVWIPNIIFSVIALLSYVIFAPK
jgi:lipopolysaccharide export system permease protein